MEQLHSKLSIYWPLMLRQSSICFAKVYVVDCLVCPTDQGDRPQFHSCKSIYSCCMKATGTMLMNGVLALARIDAKLFEFLERYFRQLEGPLALQVWGRFILMAKDVTSSMREFRVQAFATVK